MLAGPGEAQAAYIIPSDTSIQTVVMADTVQHSCSLAVTTDHDTVVRGVMLFAEQVKLCLWFMMLLPVQQQHTDCSNKLTASFQIYLSLYIKCFASSKHACQQPEKFLSSSGLKDSMPFC